MSEEYTEQKLSAPFTQSDLLASGGKIQYPTTKEAASARAYKYWVTQPIQKLNEQVGLLSVIDPDLVETKQNTPQSQMYAPYTWESFDLTRDAQLICDFLNKHNITSKENEYFRYNYTPEYLSWSLGSNYIIVGFKAGNAIGGLIAGHIGTYQVFNRELPMCVVNHMCIHPKLRNKNLAPKLIDELTRLCGQRNIQVGSFMTNIYAPRPACKVEYYNRPINYEKLRANNYINMDAMMELDKAKVAFNITHDFKYPTIKMTPAHAEKAYNLFCKYQDRYNFYRKYSFDEFVSTFITSPVISSWVILNKDSEPVDFFSYYKLNLYNVQSKDNPALDKFINVGYMYMYTTDVVTQLTIFRAVLKVASEESIDLFCATDAMENTDILFDNLSKFIQGSTFRYYNFFNLKVPDMKPEQISVLNHF